MAKHNVGSATTPIRWSAKMNRVFNEVVAIPVLNDSRSKSATKPGQNFILGYPFHTVRDDIIEAGLGDFTSGYTDDGTPGLSADEVVLCYSFINLKKHFFSALHTLLRHKTWLQPELAKANQIVVIDIGCGPATAGLAFSEFESSPITYYGVDRALPMRNHGRRMFAAGKKHGLVDDTTKSVFHSQWDAIPSSFGPKTAVVVVFSYFFASPFLKPRDIKSLAKFYRRLVVKTSNMEVFTVFTNSKRDIANKNYDAYLKVLKIDPTQSPPIEKTVHYYKNTTSAETNYETFLSEIYGAIR